MIKNRDSGNAIINSVIDAVVFITELDPGWINPDHHLKIDLKLNDESIINITRFIEKQLQVTISEKQYFSLTQTTTLREYVHLLTDWFEGHSKKGQAA